MKEHRKSHFNSTLYDLESFTLDKVEDNKGIYIAIFIVGKLYLKQNMDNEGVRLFYSRLREIYGEEILLIDSLTILLD